MLNNRKITLKFREQDAWLLAEIRNTVATKQAMGHESSVPFEVARLLRQSIIGDLDEFLERQHKLDKRLKPMQLEKTLVAEFEHFLLNKFGVKPEETTYKGELKRFMINGSKLMIIREINNGSEYYDIWMSDKQLLNKMEEEFWGTLSIKYQEDENDGTVQR